MIYRIIIPIIIIKIMTTNLSIMHENYYFYSLTNTFKNLFHRINNNSNIYHNHKILLMIKNPLKKYPPLLTNLKKSNLIDNLK